MSSLSGSASAGDCALLVQAAQPTQLQAWQLAALHQSRQPGATHTAEARGFREVSCGGGTSAKLAPTIAGACRLGEAAAEAGEALAGASVEKSGKRISLHRGHAAHMHWPQLPASEHSRRSWDVGDSRGGLL